MDARKLCLEIEKASKSLTPVSVTILSFEDRLAEVRVVAEAFATMDIPDRFKAINDCLKAHDPSILRTFNITFELLSPVEEMKWNSDSSDKGGTENGGYRKIAKDLNT